MNPLILPISAYTYIDSSFTYLPHSSIYGEHDFSRFVIDYVSMVLLFDAFTDHYANGSPTPWQDKYLSTENEVKFGNKSESDLFQENQKFLFIFALLNVKILLGNSLVTNQAIR